MKIFRQLRQDLEQEWKSARKSRQDAQSKMRRWQAGETQRNPQTIQRNIDKWTAEESRLASEIETVDEEIAKLDSSYIPFTVSNN